MADVDRTAGQRAPGELAGPGGSAGLDVQLAHDLVERARDEGVPLVGPDGLLAGVTKTVAVVAAHPRPDFKYRILAAFTEGLEDRPETTFGNVKADVLAHYLPG